jgi:hypothetical protein
LLICACGRFAPPPEATDGQSDRASKSVTPACP